MFDLKDFWGKSLSEAPFFLFLGQETGGWGSWLYPPFWSTSKGAHSQERDTFLQSLTYFLRQRRICAASVTLSLYYVSVLLWLLFLCLSFKENILLQFLYLIPYSVTLWFTLLIWYSGFDLLFYTFPYSTVISLHSLPPSSHSPPQAPRQHSIWGVLSGLWQIVNQHNNGGPYRHLPLRVDECVRLLIFHPVLTYHILFAFPDTLVALEANKGQVRAPSFHTVGM